MNKPSALPSSGAPVYRRAATIARLERALAFDRLPPAVRDRLVRGIVRGALPDPLLATRAGREVAAMRASIAAAAGAGTAAIGLWLLDMGQLHGRLALQPTWFAAVYGALIFVTVVAAAGAARLRSFQRGAPFPSGRYLFPLDLVEATGGRLHVTSLDTVRRVEARPRAVVIVFEDGHEVAFATEEHLDAGALAASVNAAVLAARALVYPDDGLALERMDPFFELRVTEDWEAASDVPRARAWSSPAWLFTGLAALVAAPAGVSLVRAHNTVSDDFMFDEARTLRPGSEPVSKGLLAYLRRGQRHLDEASRELVDGAEGDRATLARYVAQGGRTGELADDALFAAARGMNTVDAYRGYLEAGRRHADEVEKELLPEADFQQAARSPLVGSLFSFVRRNPGSKHDDDAWRLIHAAYAGAIPASRAGRRPPPEGLRFTEALLARLEERADPRVALAVQLEAPTAIADADATLGARYGARYLPAADRFYARSLEDLSRDIRAAVASSFGRAFRHGVAEITRPSAEDEGRPRFDVRVQPVVTGAGEWRSPFAPSGDTAYLTPIVGLVVEVRGRVPGQDTKDETITWKLEIADTTGSQMLAKDFRGRPRPRADLLDDAFNGFLDGVPDQIAASFRDEL